jgi:putative hydrolase of the HAD superfamily
MKYRHLFFDLDHTLWDFETNAKETLHELYVLNDLHEKDISDFDKFFSHYTYHNARLWKRYEQGFIKQSELRWKRMWHTLLEYKIGDEILAKKLATQFLERLPFKKEVFPYTAEILDYLKNKDYQLHLITNGFEEIQNSKLQSSNIHHYFKEIITSEKSQSLKPNKEIFEYALNLAKAKKEESIMIGDNLETDIEGAANAGMDTVFVNHLNIEPTVKSTFIIYHLKELEEIF